MLAELARLMQADRSLLFILAPRPEHERLWVGYQVPPEALADVVRVYWLPGWDRLLGLGVQAVAYVQITDPAEAPREPCAAGARLVCRGMAVHDPSRIPCGGCAVQVKDTRAIAAAARRSG